MISLFAIAGQRVEVDLTADAGFPVHIQIGDDMAPAWIEKRSTKSRRGPAIEAIGWRLCPTLGTGTHRIVVHDRTGSRDAGTVTIGAR